MSQTIGSSDVSAILGISPWRSAWDVREKLLGIEPPPFRAVSALERGKLVEPIIVEQFCLQGKKYKLGHNAIRGPVYEEPPLVSSDWPIAACRPDLLLWDEPPACPIWPDAIMEAKHAMILDPREWGTQRDPRIPEHYRVQVCWQAYVCGVERAYLTAWGLMDNDWRFYEVDVSDARDIVASVKAWHDAFIRDELELDGSDACARALSRPGVDGTREATAEERAIVERLRELREEGARNQDAKRAATAHLNHAMRDVSALTVDGVTIAYRRLGNVCTK